jgi:pyrroline-5-carboxylate reductase
MSKKLSVMLIGAGAMGGAMLRGWLQSGLLDPKTSFVVDPAPGAALAGLLEARGIALNPPADTPADICVLAIKPQMFEAIVPSLDWPGMEETLFVSVAAGKSIASIRNCLKETRGAAAPVVRAMPNLPASIGYGMSVLYAEDGVSDTDRDKAFSLLEATGKAIWVDREEFIDAGTAVSGSGPAYAFLLVEAMAEAGAKAGLSPHVAEALARQTLVGAGALLSQDDRSAEELRQAVTSPGGTTEAALTILDKPDGIRPLVEEAISAAVTRAHELSD